MEKALSNKRHIAIFVLPALVFFLLFVVAPLIVTGVYALFKYDGAGTMDFIGFSNFIDLFVKDEYFKKALVNSLTLAGASIFVQIPISLVLAMVLASGIKGEKTFRTIYFIPVVISSMVIGQLWMKMFNSEYGLLNLFIRGIGFKDFDHAWLSEESTAFLSTVIPSVWQYIGYHMLILYAGIKSIPTEYYEASRIDGASRFTTAVKITIPLLAPVIKTCVVFALVGSLRAFDLVYIMTGGGPNHASEVPATLMYNNLFRRGLYGYGSAQAFFIVIECLTISIVINKMFKKSEAVVSNI